MCGPIKERARSKEGCKIFASKHEHATRKHDLNEYQMLQDS